MSEKSEISESTKVIKKSAIMTEDKTKQLALARAKALEIAHQNKAVRDKEIQAKDIAKKLRAERADKALQSATEAVEAVKNEALHNVAVSVSEAKKEEIKPKLKHRKPKIVYINNSSSCSSSDSDSSADSVVYVKRKSKHRVKNKTVSNPVIETPSVVEKDYNELMTNAQLKHEVALMKRDMLRKSMFKAY